MKVNHLKLDTLVMDVSNCAFDCGAYDEEDGDDNGITYEKLVERSRQAKQALKDYVLTFETED